MEKIYKDFGFIIIFLVGVMAFESAFGEKATQRFLIIVLLSMAVLNAGKFKTFSEKILRKDK